MKDPSGYRGKALALLTKAGAEVGDVLESSSKVGKVVGTLVPRYLYGDDAHIVLKLSSGYNVGVSLAALEHLKVVSKGARPSFVAPALPRGRKGLPRVLVLGTGGTIASRVDYRTGAVKPAVSASELHALIPELSEEADVTPEILFNIFSENMGPRHWSRIARRVGTAAKEGFAGVVITQGTDTMGYTAAALSFALQGAPFPIVLVGAQRSSDRPSSDAALNLLGAVSVAAKGGFSGVYVAMHLDESDDKVAVHVGTRVRKNHTTRRDAFKSVGVPLAAVWGRAGVEHVAQGLPPRKSPAAFKPRPKFDDSATLVKFHPAMRGLAVDALGTSGCRGIVIEGTGLGHVSTEVAVSVRRFVKKGGFAGMTSQCLDGRVNLNVYETGRDLLESGVVPLQDMLPETALVKLMWALGNTGSREELTATMSSNLAGEITARTFPE